MWLLIHAYDQQRLKCTYIRLIEYDIFVWSIIYSDIKLMQTYLRDKYHQIVYIPTRCPSQHTDVVWISKFDYNKSAYTFSYIYLTTKTFCVFQVSTNVLE